MEQQEQHFSCPYCWKTISVLLDLSCENQTYVEDCENCCHPITVSYSVEDDAIVSFSADRTQ